MAMTVFERLADGSAFEGPHFDMAMAARAQESLGVLLPQGYVALMQVQNGGVLHKCCFGVDFPNSWARDHIQLDVMFGIGGDWGIDTVSAGMIAEWGYPDIGLVLGLTPAAGPDTVMLDYSECGPTGEPRVVYVDEGRHPIVLADDFCAFVDGLVSSDFFEGGAD